MRKSNTSLSTPPAVYRIVECSSVWVVCCNSVACVEWEAIEGNRRQAHDDLHGNVRDLNSRGNRMLTLANVWTSITKTRRCCRCVADQLIGIGSPFYLYVFEMFRLSWVVENIINTAFSKTSALWLQNITAQKSKVWYSYFLSFIKFFNCCSIICFNVFLQNYILLVALLASFSFRVQNSSQQGTPCQDKF